VTVLRIQNLIRIGYIWRCTYGVSNTQRHAEPSECFNARYGL